MGNHGRTPKSLRLRELTILTGVSIVACVSVLTLEAGSFVRALFGFTLVAFLPGYAFLSAIPLVESPFGGDLVKQERDSITHLALAIACSVTIAAIVGFVLNYTRWGVRPAPLALILLGTTLAFCGVAYYQLFNSEQPKEVRQLDQTVRVSILPSSRREVILSALLIIGVIVSAGSVASVVGVSIPGKGEQLTELYLSNRSDSGMSTGKNSSLLSEIQDDSFAFTVENHEGEQMKYSVIVNSQRLYLNGSNCTVRERTVERYAFHLRSGETRTKNLSLESVPMDRPARIVYLLYKGTPPQQPSVSSADLYLVQRFNTNGISADCSFGNSN